MQKNADLHLHSCFSMATSRDMLPENILHGCRAKGLHIIGSGDALHHEWRRMWQPYIHNEYDITVVPQTEVEDSSRVHHLIFMETFDQFEELQEVLEKYSPRLHECGRPHIYLSGEEIAVEVHNLGGMIGPAHAFTPWTSLFASYNKPSECYGQESFEFCELGLSADTSYGASIKEFSNIPFLTNSDAHSASAMKLGREFTRLDVSSNRPKSVLDAIRKNSVVLNAGFFPEEGKYNRTACVKCYEQFTLAEAEKLKWKCPHDNKRIKLGVRERAEQVSKLSSPTVRPPYIKMIPLGDVIAKKLGFSSTDGRAVQALHRKFIDEFDNEIAILLEVSYEDLSTVSEEVAGAVIKMRNGDVVLHPGGGGQYGSFEI